jgi:CMP-N-acetylneuraminic acid synthetase
MSNKINVQRIVALLPMKAHSERVTGKNFRDFCGKPLYRWIFDALMQVESVSQIIINTDARGILAKSGLLESDRIRIRDRNSEICGDLVSMNRVIEDDVENVNADVYLMTHTTNPLLSADTIQSALSTFLDARNEGVADSLFTVNEIQTRFYRADGSAVNHDPNNLLRTQDLEPWYEENSNLYIFTKESFMATRARIGIRPKMFVSPPRESLDIDDPAGWDFAVIAARYMAEHVRNEQ